MSSPADFLEPSYFAANGYPWAQWAELRREQPVVRVEGEIYDPFWAITRHADILAISKDPRRFISQPGNNLLNRQMKEGLAQGLSLYRAFFYFFKTGLVLQPRLLAEMMQVGKKVQETGNPADAIPMLLNMDPPEHRLYRDATRDWFTPRALGAWQGRVDRVARETVAQVKRRLTDPKRRGQPFDFVGEIAAPFPLAIIAEIMGFPEQDRAKLFTWSNATIGMEDEEYGNAEDPLASAFEGQLRLFGYFARQLADRKKNPKDDLTTVIARAQVNGEPLSSLRAIAYCFLLLIAGNETTRNAISGGMAAFIEHPGERKRLQEDPALYETMADEVVRWTSPLIHFLRHTTCDVEVGGVSIPAGETLALYYPSANRDEDAIREPERFDVGRKPNRHLGFGIGEHVCLGAHLARMEIRAAFREIFEQLPALELAGPIQRMKSDFVGGVKHLPVRFAA